MTKRSVFNPLKPAFASRLLTTAKISSAALTGKAPVWKPGIDRWAPSFLYRRKGTAASFVITLSRKAFASGSILPLIAVQTSRAALGLMFTSLPLARTCMMGSYSLTLYLKTGNAASPKQANPHSFGIKTLRSP